MNLATLNPRRRCRTVAVRQPVAARPEPRRLAPRQPRSKCTAFARHLATRRLSCGSVMLAALFGTALHCQAGTITSVNTGGAIVAASVTTAAAGNDNFTTSANPNTLTATRNHTSTGPTFLGFNHTGTVLGTTSLPTEYMVTETIQNNSGSTWLGYQLELFSGFAFDFDFPDKDPTPASSAFPLFSHASNLIMFMTGSVASGSSFTLAYALDISAGFANGFSSIQGTPKLIPEPATAALSAVPLAGVLSRRRRRHLSRRPASD